MCGAACGASARLPDYMVPSAFVVLDRLPLTVNGKLDRRRCLRRRFGVVAAASCAAHPAGGGAVRAVCRGAGARACRVDDNFFALGGDSIMSIQLVSRARQAGLADHAAGGVPASDRGGAGAARHARRCACGRLRRRSRHRRRCRRPRSCAGCWSAADRSIASARRCCCGCRRAAGGSSDRGAAGGARPSRWVAAAAGASDATMRRAGDCAAGHGGGAGCLRRIDVCGASTSRRCGPSSSRRRGRRAAACPRAGVMVQAVWFDAGARRPAGCC